MFLGAKAFQWESSESVANGARWVLLGVKFALWFLLIQLVVAGGWFMRQGSDFVKEMLASGGSPFAIFIVIGAICIILLFELLIGAFRRGGSIRMAGYFAIILFFILAVSVNSARLTLNQNNFFLSGWSDSAEQFPDRSR